MILRVLHQAAVAPKMASIEEDCVFCTEPKAERVGIMGEEFGPSRVSIQESASTCGSLGCEESPTWGPDELKGCVCLPQNRSPTSTINLETGCWLPEAVPSPSIINPVHS